MSKRVDSKRTEKSKSVAIARREIRRVYARNGGRY